MAMNKKSYITFDEMLNQDPKLKKKFSKEFTKYQNRPKPNKNLKIGLEYIRKNFNLDLFLKNIVKKNYKYWEEGNMLNRIINYGFEKEEVYKIYDHLDAKEYDKLYKLADRSVHKFFLKFTNNFEFIDGDIAETSEYFWGTFIIYANRNDNYYLFLEDHNPENRGNCLYFKSINEKIILNRMNKLIKNIKRLNKLPKISKTK